jgi:hypothetical protein
LGLRHTGLGGRTGCPPGAGHRRDAERARTEQRSSLARDLGHCAVSIPAFSGLFGCNRAVPSGLAPVLPLDQGRIRPAHSSPFERGCPQRPEPTGITSRTVPARLRDEGHSGLRAGWLRPAAGPGPGLGARHLGNLGQMPLTCRAWIRPSRLETYCKAGMRSGGP